MDNKREMWVLCSQGECLGKGDEKIFIYEWWAQTPLLSEIQGYLNFQRAKHPRKCAMSPGVLQERNGNVEGIDQVGGNKAGGGLGLTEPTGVHPATCALTTHSEGKRNVFSL